MANEVTLGNGSTLICSIERDGRKGILLMPTSENHQVDSSHPGWLDTPTYKPKADDVIIWIDNLSGARVLQDRVNIMTLEQNRFKVLDA